MADKADPKKVIDGLVEDLRNIPDPLEQALAAGRLMESFKSAVSQSKDIRIGAVQTLSGIGWGYQRIAESLGVSKPRVQQLLKAPAVPRRPGILEQRSKVLAAEMRAKGRASDSDIAFAAVEQIRRSRGGANWTTEQIAGWIEVDESFVIAADKKFASTQR